MILNFKATVFVMTLLFMGLFRLFGQEKSIIVNQIEKIPIDSCYQDLFCDIYLGYSEEYKDTIGLVSIHSSDILFSPKIGDSICFIAQERFKMKNSIARYLKSDLILEMGVEFVYGHIRTICRETIFTDSCYGSGKNTSRECRTLIGPLYYLDGKPIFSENKKENRKQKRRYKKVVKKNK